MTFDKITNIKKNLVIYIHILTPVKTGFAKGIKMVDFRGGGAHWALEQWYVTLRPKYVILEPRGPKITQFCIQNHHSSAKNVSKIFVLYLRDFL